MQRTPTDFYNALPSRKIELHDGKLLVGGSIEKTAMAMSFILNAYGAEYAGYSYSCGRNRPRKKRICPSLNSPLF